MAATPAVAVRDARTGAEARAADSAEKRHDVMTTRSKDGTEPAARNPRAGANRASRAMMAMKSSWEILWGGRKPARCEEAERADEMPAGRRRCSVHSHTMCSGVSRCVLCFAAAFAEAVSL